jgi:glycosyltransferase involved in cell wall biosynthesis
MNLPDNKAKVQEIHLPGISVIIPFSGNSDDLAFCLQGLKHQKFKYEFEIIVVKSGDDLPLNDLADLPTNTRIITSSTLMYPGKARNSGVRNSKAELLAFIDADCVPDAGWLSAVYSSLKKGNDIAVGPVINLHPFHPIASVDNLFLFADFQKQRPSKNFEHFAGCNFGITRNLYQEVGGFREDMIIAEDTKFSESAIQKGKIAFDKKMIVRHSGRKELKKFRKHHESFGFYKGYLNLRESTGDNKLRKHFFYPFLLGARRMIYISIRTLQWNPAGLLRIIFYFPFLFLGLSSWIKGFRKGQSEYLSEMSLQDNSTLKNKPENHE